MKKLTSLLFCFVLTAASSFAADINWDELEKKAQRYTEDQESGNSGESGDEKPNSINLVLPSQPQSRTIDSAATALSEADKRHITVHMKLANRHFSKKNYDKAIEEVELVFEREPDNFGGRFMRAVIAGRLKDHQTAWHNIVIAREKDAANPKVASFIDKLKTVAPEPVNPRWVPGVFRSIPVSASEKACDIIERLLIDPVSQNIVNLTTGDYINEAGTVFLPLTLECSSAPDATAITAVLSKACGSEVTTTSNASTTLGLKVAIKDLAIENPAVKPISDLSEFVKGLTEEIDVAISDTVEREAENKVLDITYEVSSRDFKTLNSFLRKVSPYAKHFRVLSMRLAYITGSQSIIWKCKIQVFYQLS